MSTLRIASFHVRATMPQSIRWKIAAESEGRSVGQWLAAAADSYLRMRARAGLPVPLAWHRGRFRVRLLDGTEPELAGWMAEPFGFYCGDQAGPGYHGRHLYTLVYLPDLRALGTFRYARDCRVFASDLASRWTREQAPTAPP